MTLYYEKAVSLIIQSYQYMRCVSRAFCLEVTFPAFVLSCTEHTTSSASVLYQTKVGFTLDSGSPRCSLTADYYFDQRNMFLFRINTFLTGLTKHWLSPWIKQMIHWIQLWIDCCDLWPPMQCQMHCTSQLALVLRKSFIIMVSCHSLWNSCYSWTARGRQLTALVTYCFLFYL